MENQVARRNSQAIQTRLRLMPWDAQVQVKSLRSSVGSAISQGWSEDMTAVTVSVHVS